MAASSNNSDSESHMELTGQHNHPLTNQSFDINAHGSDENSSSTKKLLKSKESNVDYMGLTEEEFRNINGPNITLPQVNPLYDINSAAVSNDSSDENSSSTKKLLKSKESNVDYMGLTEEEFRNINGPNITLPQVNPLYDINSAADSNDSSDENSSSTKKLLKCGVEYLGITAYGLRNIRVHGRDIYLPRKNTLHHNDRTAVSKDISDENSCSTKKSEEWKVDYKGLTEEEFRNIWINGPIIHLPPEDTGSGEVVIEAVLEDLSTSAENVWDLKSLVDSLVKDEPLFCEFCFKNVEFRSIYTNHNLTDPFGNMQCPMIQAEISYISRREFTHPSECCGRKRRRTI